MRDIQGPMKLMICKCQALNLFKVNLRALLWHKGKANSDCSMTDPKERKGK